MKIIFPAILFFAAGVFISNAQTNTQTYAATNSPGAPAPQVTTNQPHGVDAILALVNTNQMPTATNPPAKPPGTMRIWSDGPLVVDMNSHWLVYRDHVSVTYSDPQAKLTCEWLEGNIPENGEHPTNIVALTNVVIDFTNDKGQKTHATGQKAVYFYHVENNVTNDTVTLTGNPEITMGPKGQDITRCDAIIWDRTTGKYTLTLPNGVYSGDIVHAATTNSPAAKTNPPAKPSGG